MRMTLMGISLVCTLFMGSLPASTQEGPDELEKRSQKFQKEVTRLRGVGFKEKVNVGIYSKDQLLKFISTEFKKELPPEKAKRYEKAYQHFKLIPDDMDLFQSLIVLFAESIAGFYHPKTKELKLVRPEEGSPEGGNMMGIDQEAITFVHELTHAAQDQNFDLVTLPMEEITNDDMVSAVKCLVEGEASIVGWKYGFDATFDQVIKLINNQYKSGMLPGKAGKLPRYLRETLTFSYGYGCDFVLAVWKGNEENWDAITAMYDDLPSSTEQVLHPEKYWKDRDNPTVITLPKLDKEWDLLTNNVFGEFVVRIVLREVKASRRSSRKASEGWDGDRYHIYEKEGGVSSAWYTTWDTEEDAKEFFSAYLKGLEKTFPRDEESTTEPEEGSIDSWSIGKGRSIHIERKGSDVLILNGDNELVGKAQWYWDNAEKKELDHVKRFKKGSWTCKDHPEVDHDINSYCPECEARLIPKKKSEKKDRKDY